jgi:actin-like ATPase involved in cell morphogenesis
MGWFNFFTQEIAIDLGTANTVVYRRGDARWHENENSRIESGKRTPREGFSLNVGGG